MRHTNHPSLYRVVILLICFSAKINAMTLEQFYHNKQVLITGGCGFIGSHIAHQLVALNARVTILDNLTTGSLENIKDIQEKITFIHGDITDFATCLNATKQCDIIFHLAALISVPESMCNPAACHLNNVTGTFNILEAARINGVSGFVFSSSAAVYGPVEGVCTEDTACNPQSPYGFSKLIGEHLCTQYYINFNVATVILRYFNVWGEGQNPTGAYAPVVAKFSDNMKNNKSIKLFGDGLQTRDFIHVNEVAHANVLAGMKAQQLTTNRIFNIATGSSITLLALIDSLKKQFPTYNQPIEFFPARPGDIYTSTADCNRYKTMLIK